MKKRHSIRKCILTLFAVLLCMAAVVCTFYGIKGYRLYRDTVAQASIAERVEETRAKEHFTGYSDLPEFYINAVISVEDHRFRSHPGIDLIAICRATWTDLKAGAYVEGGSTITQQLAKNLLFTQEKTVERKAAEVFAAFALEAEYSKEEIFELYANTVYFGSGYYGIEDAAEGYFGKEPSELNDYEAAMLAGIPNAPSVYSPDVNPTLTSQRVGQVLDSMVKNGFLGRDEADKIKGMGRNLNK